MNILGIDPMDHGALALFSEQEGVVTVVDMPVLMTTKTKPELDMPRLWEILTNCSREKVIVYIEKMQPMPPAFGGGFANFKRGAYLYLFRAFFVALALTYYEIPPRTWMQHFKIKPSENTKIQSYLIASRLFPYLDLKTKKDKILDGRCDAALICEFGRMCQRSSEEVR